jgi:hypothetical protein
MSLKIRWLYLLLILVTDENTQKNKVPMFLLAKIKWKTPRVCVKIENKCKRTEKNQNFRHNCPI